MAHSPWSSEPLLGHCSGLAQKVLPLRLQVAKRECSCPHYMTWVFLGVVFLHRRAHHGVAVSAPAARARGCGVEALWSKDVARTALACTDAHSDGQQRVADSGRWGGGFWLGFALAWSPPSLSSRFSHPRALAPFLRRLRTLTPRLSCHLCLSVVDSPPAVSLRSPAQPPDPAGCRRRRLCCKMWT